MNYEEMVKLAYEDILDNLVDEEDFEKEAANAFSRLFDRDTYTSNGLGYGNYHYNNLPKGVSQNWTAVRETRADKFGPGDFRFNNVYGVHEDAAAAHRKTLADYKAGKATVDDLKRTGGALKSATRDMLNAGRDYKRAYPDKPLQIEEKMRRVDPNFSRGKTGRTLEDIKAAAIDKKRSADFTKTIQGMIDNGRTPSAAPTPKATSVPSPALDGAAFKKRIQSMIDGHRK